MEEFIVSARKYRPDTFRSVVGQHALTTTLRNAVITKKLAHAYLFCGPRGVGKTTCARIFAKTINCSNPTGEGEACNQCESCTSFNDQRSYNIHELDAASNNSVDDIRSLIEQVRIPPQIGEYKVYIIDEVHMLSLSAFNAFLKTLEEPPRHAIFVLATTEKHKILPTILSRCQIYDFNRISINDTVEHLIYVSQQESVSAEPEALNIIAQKADGGMRDALSIFDQVVSFTGGNITYKAVIDNLNVLDYDYYFNLVESFLSSNVTNALLIFNQVLNNGFEGNNFITGLSSHFRDLLVARDPQTIVLLEVGESIGQKYQQQAQNCAPLFLYRALEISNECDLNYRLSKNKRLLVELALIKLCQILQPQLSQSPSNDLKPIQPSKTTVPNASVTTATAPVSVSNVGTSMATDNANTYKSGSTPNVLINTGTQTTSTQPTKSVSASRGISIKSPIKKSNDEQVSTTNEISEMNSQFEISQVISAFKKYEIQIHSEKVLIKKTLSTSKIELTDSTKIEIKVEVPDQQELLESELISLIPFLKTELQNSYIQVKISLMEVTEQRKAYNNHEKFIAMATQNPELYHLKDVFGLEIA